MLGPYCGIRTSKRASEFVNTIYSKKDDEKKRVALCSLVKQQEKFSIHNSNHSFL